MLLVEAFEVLYINKEAQLSYSQLYIYFTKQAPQLQLFNSQTTESSKGVVLSYIARSSHIDEELHIVSFYTLVANVILINLRKLPIQPASRSIYDSGLLSKYQRIRHLLIERIIIYGSVKL